MKKETRDFKSCLQPSVKIIVSCRGNDGRDNALAVGYAGNCSYDPPMVILCLQNIVVIPVFTVNWVEQKICRLIW